jgi:hypothetical protein
MQHPYQSMPQSKATFHQTEEVTATFCTVGYARQLFPSPLDSRKADLNLQYRIQLMSIEYPLETHITPYVSRNT